MDNEGGFRRKREEFWTAATLVEVVNDGGGGLRDGAEEGSGVKR